MEVLVEVEVTPKDVGKWNMVQMRAWKQFIKKANIEIKRNNKRIQERGEKRKHKDLLDENDIKLLMKYGKWYRDFFNNRMRIPLYKEVPSLSQVTNYKGSKQKRKNI